MTDPNRTILNAMRQIQELVAKRLHPEDTMTMEQFEDAVIAAADDREVVRAVRAAANPDNQDAPLSPTGGAVPPAKT